MNIKKVDDKPMVIHTKEKTKLHVKTAPETKIKAGNVLTVERTPKFAGAEREAKADNMDKRMSALKVNLYKSCKYASLFGYSKASNNGYVSSCLY